MTLVKLSENQLIFIDENQQIVSDHKFTPQTGDTPAKYTIIRADRMDWDWDFNGEEALAMYEWYFKVNEVTGQLKDPFTILTEDLVQRAHQQDRLSRELNRDENDLQLAIRKFELEQRRTQLKNAQLEAAITPKKTSFITN